MRASPQDDSRPEQMRQAMQDSFFDLRRNNPLVDPDGWRRQPLAGCFRRASLCEERRGSNDALSATPNEALPSFVATNIAPTRR